MSGFLPGTATLIEELDKRLMVLLRDGRTLIGWLRSVDQFANLVLHRTIERIHVGKKYGDIDRGVFIIRGENVVLCGEVDSELEQKMDLIRVPVEEILEAQQKELDAKMEKERVKVKAMQERGLSCPLDIHDDF